MTISKRVAYIFDLKSFYWLLSGAPKHFPTWGLGVE